MRHESATVMLTATLAIPSGTGRHNERRLVLACPDCAAFILLHQYLPHWDWDAMAPTVAHGDYGACYQCPDTAARKRAQEAAATREP